MVTSPGVLYLVATPIGNLGELSPRAAEVLGTVDCVLAEDTRHTRRLLSHLGISRPLTALHEHNEVERTDELVGRLEGGERLALVSDAGTPALSDPGFRFVRAVREAGIPIESVAGPSALAAAIAAAGFDPVPLVFLGFPPSRAGERRRYLEQWLAVEATVALYEAPHRITKTLADLEALGAGDRRAVLLREMTKLHEEGIDGTVTSIREELERREKVRGEMVLVLDRPIEVAAESAIDPVARFIELREAGTSRRDALAQAAAAAGIGKSELRRRIAAAEVEK